MIVCKAVCLIKAEKEDVGYVSCQCIPNRARNAEIKIYHKHVVAGGKTKVRVWGLCTQV